MEPAVGLLVLALVCLIGTLFGSVAWAARTALSAFALTGLFIGSVLVYQQLTAAPSQTALTTTRAGGAETGGNGVVLRRQRDGHFYANLQVNGADITFVVDTGATSIVLTRADAARAGIDPGSLRYTGIAATANGPVRFAPVTLDRVLLEGSTDRDVAATVNDGRLETSLLGMSYLERYAELTISGDRMILRR
ncbi:MAG: TIGR02281 family clan AA aspartic protease [Pseudomonadota bacterium]